jgi:hypothetical protein
MPSLGVSVVATDADGDVDVAVASRVRCCGQAFEWRAVAQMLTATFTSRWHPVPARLTNTHIRVGHGLATDANTDVHVEEVSGMCSPPDPPDHAQC